MFGSSNQNKGFKLGHRERTVLMEALEERSLLSVNPVGGSPDMVPAVYAECVPAPQEIIANEVGATQLTSPDLEAEAKDYETVLVKVHEVNNASGYKVQYATDDSFTDPTTVSVQAGQTSIGGLESGTKYYFRAWAVGDGEEYLDSSYSNTVNATTEEVDSPKIQVDGKTVKVSWDDDSEAADLVRYRVKDTTKWTVKKLKKDTTEFSFNGKLDTTYEIEVWKDQNESNLLRGTATVLAKPKLSVVKESITDSSFDLKVDNYNDSNLAENTSLAIVTINGKDQYVFIKDGDEQGEAENENTESPIDIPGSSSIKVSFDKATGTFSLTELESNTSYKVSVAFGSFDFNFSMGGGTSSSGFKFPSSVASNTVNVKTLITPYEAPTNVQAKATGDTTVEVSWEASDAPKYTVEYSTDGEKWKKATTKAEGTSYTIQKLKGATEYQVRVSATKDNKCNASDPCYSESVTTLPTPKLTLDKASVTSSAFKMNVETLGYANVIHVMSNTFEKVTIYLDGGKGSAIIDAGTGFTVSYEDGVLSFTDAPANTQQKVQISLGTDDGVCTTSWSKAVSVKTAKA